MKTTLTITLDKPIADQLATQGLKISSESSVPFQTMADSVNVLQKRGLLKDIEVQKITRRLAEKLEHHVEADPSYKPAPVVVAIDPKTFAVKAPKAPAKAVN